MPGAVPSAPATTTTARPPPAAGGLASSFRHLPSAIDTSVESACIVYAVGELATSSSSSSSSSHGIEGDAGSSGRGTTAIVNHRECMLVSTESAHSAAAVARPLALSPCTISTLTHSRRVLPMLHRRPARDRPQRRPTHSHRAPACVSYVSRRRAAVASLDAGDTGDAAGGRARLKCIHLVIPSHDATPARRGAGRRGRPSRRRAVLCLAADARRGVRPRRQRAGRCRGDEAGARLRTPPRRCGRRFAGAWSMFVIVGVDGGTSGRRATPPV